MDEEKKRYRWPIVMLQGLPMAGLFTYVFGFIAINIHLGKFGIFEFNILSSWYVIGGILYIAFLVVWYYFCGQFLWRMLTGWYGSGVEEATSFGSHLLTWIRLVFLTCVSTALFSIIFLESAEAVFFCVFAFILRFIGPRWENFVAYRVVPGITSDATDRQYRGAKRHV